MVVFFSLLGACNDAGFAVVSISPIFGWTDGCNPVTISGRGFSSSATATVGGSVVSGVTFPEAPKSPLSPSDIGYVLYGSAPAGEHGYADVSVKSDGVTSTISGTGAYYYVTCPAAGTVEAVTPSEGLAGGETVILDGCGLDVATISARVVSVDRLIDSGTLPLSSLCGKGSVSFTAPALAEGSYFLELVDIGTGDVLSGAPCPPGDSADTGSSCTDHPLVYGASQ